MFRMRSSSGLLEILVLIDLGEDLDSMQFLSFDVNVWLSNEDC
jgi:hypothetical protein